MDSEHIDPCKVGDDRDSRVREQGRCIKLGEMSQKVHRALKYLDLRHD